MDRSLELRIKGHLYEIEAVNDEVLDTRQGLPPAIGGYRESLESVANQADAELVDRVAEEIKEHIREHEERPANQSVRKDARTLLMEEGIPPDEYLNEA